MRLVQAALETLVRQVLVALEAARVPLALAVLEVSAVAPELLVHRLEVRQPQHLVPHEADSTTDMAPALALAAG